MAGKSEPEHRLEDRKRLGEAVQATQEASKALIKDAAALIHQAALLKAGAAETRVVAQEARALAGPALSPSKLLSIPEAARRLQVAERALRHVLTEPDLEARLVERTRKVGIYYKFIPLLPPDLMADLSVRLADETHRNIETGHKDKTAPRKREERPTQAEISAADAEDGGASDCTPDRPNEVAPPHRPLVPASRSG